MTERVHPAVLCQEEPDDEIDCEGAPDRPCAVQTSKAPAPKPTTTKKAPAPKPTTAAPKDVYYKNCSEARAAGAAPIYRGQPGYASHLDRDNDGVACE
ncbi:excalibur calcium-binding domain-containing protein [Aestuariimicrobium ganziense]|uniref:excalibur calcium-binding domain-containing protein n=1 Tax=Aestuariimicrobium ganziense TaxID=2773677 RepID=UPI001940B5D5|nr:excalibur calcium-binding domain-containing protein [Aestuariimicrobium ganziense]